MARQQKNPSALAKWRLNQGIQTGDIMAKTGLRQPTVYRIERGESTLRVTVVQYLSFWGGDLNNLSMFPRNLKVIDDGASVRISLQNTTE